MNEKEGNNARAGKHNLLYNLFYSGRCNLSNLKKPLRKLLVLIYPIIEKEIIELLETILRES